MVAKDPQTVPRTTHIELFRDYKTRKNRIEAEYKLMEKQRKDLQDQVNHCREQIEQLQCQLLNRDVHCGCNKVSRVRFDKYDHANSEII
jgi:hypothetical protein